MQISALFLTILAQNRTLLIASVLKISLLGHVIVDLFNVDAKDASFTRKLREQALRKPPENDENEPQIRRIPFEILSSGLAAAQLI